MNTIDSSQVRIIGNDVFVRRSRIMIERPNIDTNHVQIFSDGIWGNLASVSDRLRMKNNQMALNQLISRANMPFLVEAARRAAVLDEEVNVRRTLAAAGHTNVTVHIVG